MSYDTSKMPETMQKRYLELPEEVTELFEYGTVEHVIDDLIKEFGLRSSDKDTLKMEIELVLMGFLTREGLPERLRDSLSIEENRANEISEKLNEDLFVIVGDYINFVELKFSEGGDIKEPKIIVPPKQNETPKEPLIVAPPKPKESAPEKEPETKPKVEEKENTYSKVKPLRTFAMDVDMSRAHSYGTSAPSQEQDEDDEPVHSSSQDDILKK